MTDPTGDSLAEVIGKALTDDAFRKSMKDDLDGALKPFKLAPGDVKTLKELDPDILEDQAKKLGGNTALTIAVKICKSF